jgi:hypothetical protein
MHIRRCAERVESHNRGPVTGQLQTSRRKRVVCLRHLDDTARRYACRGYSGSNRTVPRVPISVSLHVLSSLAVHTLRQPFSSVPSFITIFTCLTHWKYSRYTERHTSESAILRVQECSWPAVVHPQPLSRWNAHRLWWHPRIRW